MGVRFYSLLFRPAFPSPREDVSRPSGQATPGHGAGLCLRLLRFLLGVLAVLLGRRAFVVDFFAAIRANAVAVAARAAAGAFA